MTTRLAMTQGRLDSRTIKQRADEEHLHPQFLLLNLLQQSLGLTIIDYRPRDEWEKRLHDGARDYGVSVPDEALSSEGLYH